MKHLDPVISVLQKYNLRSPVPFWNKLRIRFLRGKIFTRILKADTSGLFSLGLAVRIRYLLRAVGLNVTLAAGARIGYASMGAAATAVFALVFFTAALPRIGNSPLVQYAALADGAADIQKPSGARTPLENIASIGSGDRIDLEEGKSLYIEAGKHHAVFSGKGSFVIRSKGNATVFELDKGSILSRVSPLAKGEEYLIRTPDAEIRVKGTIFRVSSAGSETVVTVKEGIVAATILKTGEKIEVNAGFTASLTETATVRKAEQTELAPLETFGLEDLPPLKEENSGAIIQLMKKIIQPAAAQEKENQSKPLTLEDIRAKYGRLDELTLFDGRLVKGAIILRGSIIRIVTPGGIMSLKADDIRGMRTL